MVYIPELDAIMRPSIVTGTPRLFHLSGPFMGGPPTILRDRAELDAMVRQARLEARLKACANLRRPPLPSPLAKELANTESTGDLTGKSSLVSEPTATTSSVVSRTTSSRFRRCTPVSSATGTTTVTTTSTESTGDYFSGGSSLFHEPTTTTSSVVSHNPPSRFRRCTPVSSASGTTTVTTTTTSRGSYSTHQSVRPDPVRQTTLPPPPPPQPRVQKPRKTIEIDHLPGGKFPRVGNKLIYDTSPETMARTGEEDRSIWNWIKKWGTGFGEQGMPWQCMREWQWRKRSACAREAIRRAEQERRDRKRQFVYDLRIDSYLQALAQQKTRDDTESDDDHSTIVSGILDLASRWSSVLAKTLGFRS